MTKNGIRPYYRWPTIIDAARDIVDSYDTPVTLRQLFYQLVSAQLCLNTKSHYSRLSELTAEAAHRPAPGSAEWK
jgi:hypothetical protein